ncbi:MAG: hypothetical protein AAF533_06160 [Acidobacteriota bacterium]
MDDILASGRRGLQILGAAWLPLFFAAAVWAGINLITQYLLIGPALVGLFAIGLAAHEGRRPELIDGFAAFDAAAAPLVAGWALVLPLITLRQLGGTDVWQLLVPVAAALTWFSLAIATCHVLADHGRLPLSDAVAEGWRLCDATPEPGRRFSGLGGQLVVGSCSLGLFYVAAWIHPFLAFAVTPVMMAFLTAWLALRSCPSETVDLAAPVATIPAAAPAVAEAAEVAATPEPAPKTEAAPTAEAPVETPRPARKTAKKKTASRVASKKTSKKTAKKTTKRSASSRPKSTDAK